MDLYFRSENSLWTLMSGCYLVGRSVGWFLTISKNRQGCYTSAKALLCAASLWKISKASVLWQCSALTSCPLSIFLFIYFWKFVIKPTFSLLNGSCRSAHNLWIIYARQCPQKMGKGWGREGMRGAKEWEGGRRIRKRSCWKEGGEGGRRGGGGRPTATARGYLSNYAKRKLKLEKVWTCNLNYAFALL